MGLGQRLVGVSTLLLAPMVFGQGMNAQWVEVANNFPGDLVPDYSAAAQGNDPALANTPARTFDLVVSTLAPVRWSSCDLQVGLTGSQTFYQSPSGSMRDPKSATWTTAPANEFSTFLSIYNYGPVLNNFPGGILLGKAQYPVESGVGTATLTPTRIDAAWGTFTLLSGVGTIARMTVLNSFNGGTRFEGRVGTANNVANQEITYTSCGFLMQRLVAAVNADATEDGSVDTADFNVLAGHFGQTGSLPVSSGNFNGDSVVDSLDLNVLISQYGTHPSGAPIGGAVPEPMSASLLAFVGLGVRRKRDR